MPGTPAGVPEGHKAKHRVVQDPVQPSQQEADQEPQKFRDKMARDLNKILSETSPWTSGIFISITRRVIAIANTASLKRIILSSWNSFFNSLYGGVPIS